MTETSGFPVRSASRTFLGKQTADMKRRVPGGSEHVLPSNSPFNYPGGSR